MFGIGLSEIIIVFLIVIIFVRPEDLPKFVRTVGRLYGKAKRIYNDLISVKDRIIKEIDDAATLEISSSKVAIAPPEKADAPSVASPAAIPAERSDPAEEETKDRAS